MKRSSSALSTLLLCGSIACCARMHAQPTWRFHLAFEDATGARDTIWLIWDTTATLGSFGAPEVDTAFESAIEMDTIAFNVWVYNWDLDSTKTVAYPYSFFPDHGAEIRAFHCQYPITLRWDTSLFHASYLPDPAAINYARMDCGHFFFYNNDPGLHAFNMLIDDTVQVEMMWPNDALFPLELQVGHGSTIGIVDAMEAKSTLVLWPNPAGEMISLTVPGVIADFSVRSTTGALVLTGYERENGQADLDVSGLTAGLYYITVRSTSNSIYHATFIKRT